MNLGSSNSDGDGDGIGNIKPKRDQQRATFARNLTLIVCIPFGQSSWRQQVRLVNSVGGRA